MDKFEKMNCLQPWEATVLIDKENLKELRLKFETDIFIREFHIRK